MNPIEKAYQDGVAYAVKTAARKEKGPTVGERVLGGLGGALGGGLLGAEGGHELGSRHFKDVIGRRAPEAFAMMGGLGGAGVGTGVGAASPRLGATLAGGGLGSQLGAAGGESLARLLGAEDPERRAAAASIGKLLGAVGGGLGARALTS